MSGFEVKLQVEIKKGATYRETRNYYLKKMSDTLESLEKYPGLEESGGTIMSVHLTPLKNYSAYDYC
jgi:hypothetical protein